MGASHYITGTCTKKNGQVHQHFTWKPQQTQCGTIQTMGDQQSWK